MRRNLQTGGFPAFSEAFVVCSETVNSTRIAGNADKKLTASSATKKPAGGPAGFVAFHYF
jgi:hypothetical protein